MPRPTKHDNSQHHRPPACTLTMAQLAAEFDLAYRKWCRRRGFSDHNDFNFRAQVHAGMGEARAERQPEHQPAKPRKGAQDTSLAATIAALDACPETLPDSLLL